jgi:hypothetical protein
MVTLLYPRFPKGEDGIQFYLCPSVRPSFGPSKIFFVPFFSVTVDGRNLIFSHKLYRGSPYRGKRFLTRRIPTSGLPKSISSQFILFNVYFIYNSGLLRGLYRFHCISCLSLSIYHFIIQIVSVKWDYSIVQIAMKKCLKISKG